MKIKLVGLLLCFAILISAVLVGPGVLPVTAATLQVPGQYSTIQDAVAAASPGDTINVAAGTYVLTSQVNLNKASLTLTGAGRASTIIQVSGTGYGFYITASGVTMSGLGIQKTDKTGVQNIIYIGANDVSITNNEISGQFAIGDADVSRAMEVAGGLSGLSFSGNTLHNLRQPAYINGITTGTISSNSVYLTQGWVVAQGNMTFTNNTWGTGANANVYDIAILNTVGSTYYTDILAMAAANNGAVIEDQRPSPAVLSVVYVDGSVASTGDGTARSPNKTITEGITRVVTGGTVNVAAGTYSGTVTIGKSLSLLGAQAGVDARGRTGSESVIDAGLTAANPSAIVVSSAATNMVIDGFRIVGSRGAVKSDSVNIEFLNNIVEANASTYGTNTAALVYIDGGANRITLRHNDISPTPVLSVGTNCLRLAITSAAASVVIDSNWLRNATHETAYQGSGQGIGIDSTGAAITMTNNSFYENGGDGMFVGTNSTFGTLTGTGNSFYNNTYWGLNVGSGTTGLMSITNGSFYGNGAGGLQNNSTNTIDATNNSWGDATGPYNAVSNPGGLGNAVSSNIAYVPWTGMVITPIVGSVSPNWGYQGQTLASVVIGGTYLTGASAVSFGAGITVNSFTVNSDTRITANITIAAGAIIGARDVSVTTSGGIGTRTGGFTVVSLTPPAAPTLVSPANGGTVTGGSVTYQWNPVAGAVSYRLIVSTSTNPFTTTGRKGIYDVVGFTTYADSGYPGSGTYYWWVWAIDASGTTSPWSAVSANRRNFTNMPTVPAPTLVSPANGGTVTGTSVTYQWNPVAGAVSYRLIVSTSTSPFTTEGRKGIYDVVGVTTYADSGYPGEGTYNWWVWAYGADGTSSPWSAVSANHHSFTNLPTVAAPTLLSPANGGSVVGTAVTYEWTPVDGAVSYRLIISTSTLPFTTEGRKGIYDVVGVTTYADSGYPGYGTYRWWVLAFAADGTYSLWSQVLANSCSFANLPSVATPTLVSPANGGVVSATSVTYQWNPVAGAVSYQLVVSTSTNPFTTTGRKGIFNTGTAISYADSGYANAGTKYYWWVVAIAADGTNSLWSEAIVNRFNFTNGP